MYSEKENIPWCIFQHTGKNSPSEISLGAQLYGKAHEDPRASHQWWNRVLSFLEKVNSWFYLWRRTLSFKSNPCDNKVLKLSLFSILLETLESPLSPPLREKSLQTIPTYMVGIERVWGVISNPQGSRKVPFWQEQKGTEDCQTHQDIILYITNLCCRQREIKRKRESCMATARENSEKILGLTRMQVKQINSRHWMNYSIFCLFWTSQKHRTQFRPKSEFYLKTGGKSKIKILILIQSHINH